MKVLVTGGAGFIGSNIVLRLLEMGYSTVVMDNLSTGKKEYVNPEAKFYQMDISSPEVEEVFREEKITHIVHHAAQIDVQRSIQDPLFDIKNNIIGIVNLLECSKKYNIKKIIYASSAAVYGEPDYLPIDEEHPIKAMSPYGISKYTPEHYIRVYNELYNIDYTIFRYANVYGPRQDPKGEGGVISIFIDKMLAGKAPIIYGDGEQTRDFIYVADVVKANIMALTAGSGKTLNISCNTQVSINILHEIINDILGTKIGVVYQEERKGDIKHSCLDNSNAKKYLNWQPSYNLREGLRNTIEYYLSFKEVAITKKE